MNIEPIIKLKNKKKYISQVSIYDFINLHNKPAIIFNAKRINDLSLYFVDLLKKSYNNSEVHYAIKACYTPAVIKIMEKNGVKFEIMSDFEYKILKKLNVQSQDIIFNGPGKTYELLEKTINDNIEIINVDSESELRDIISIAKKYNKIVKVGIRIQPDVPNDSFLIRGEKLGMDQKSGQAEEIIKKYKDNKWIDFCGIQFHSFINQKNGKNIINALIEVINFVQNMNLKYNFKPTYFDIGGGLSTIENWNINEFEDYISQLGIQLKKLEWNPKLIIEPGRFLVSDCAIAVAKIIRKKINGNLKWLIVNANSNMLIPLATADFKVESINYNFDEVSNYNVGDCLCSASGTIERNVILPNNIEENDYVIIKNVGAYTINLSEPFAEPILPIYIVDGEDIKLIHKGVTIDEMINYFLGCDYNE